ncbi:MAG: outer membrane protein assembly factor BamD [Verrucomicrobia bacterium]|nr:outer membrane protein assembly factor BamD [Verrucomicrobiota bacterium]
MTPAAKPAYAIVLDVTLLLIAVGLVLWALWRWLKRSDSPAMLIVQWILTLITLAGLYGLVRHIDTQIAGGTNAAVAFYGVGSLVVIALILTVIWRHNIAGLIAKPFSSLYDGGDTEVDPQAFYSIAITKRKRGKYDEAVKEIRKQLKHFPKDLNGHMLLAEIQAEHLNDLPGAELTIHRFCQQPGHTPPNIAFALNALADWHLKYALDREAAQRELETIVQQFPETEYSQAALQRIAHLAGREQLLAAHDRPKMAVPHGVESIGLLHSTGHLMPKATDPEALALEFVKHLEQFPQDAEAREKLACLYADHYKRLDLAADQLEQLIAEPNQPTRSLVRWLNLLADFQVRLGAGYDAAWLTLGRIIEMNPTAPAADMARNRMDLLKLELRSKEKSRAIKLGSYEQNIGLKGGSTH